MGTIRTIYLSGLGAIGSAFAGKLFKYDPECIRVIADRERIERYRRDGVYINEEPYSFRFVSPDVQEESADLIIIAVKQHHLEASIKAIRNFVGERTIILSLLNGITSEEIIGREYGMERMLYSFVVGTDAVRAGTKTRFSNIGRIVFGEKVNQMLSPKVKAVKEVFDQAGIPYRIPEDMQRELWWKFMMNVGINQTSAVLRAPYGTFQRVPEARKLMELAAGEVLRLAEKTGIKLTPEDIQSYFEIINGLAPEGKTSMLQDVEAGRKTEVEIFAGTVTALGRQYGIPTPVNELLLLMIRTLEQTSLNQ